MKIFKTKTNLLKEISGLKDIAFVPTMGSIHKGHLSLISKAKRLSKNILVSIYINPKQFNSSTDFNKYPRMISKDILLLKKIKVKYLYLPKYSDIYSFKTKYRIYLDKFSRNLCGKFRPGHFKGVVNVVNRFIEIIKPHSILLGVKDFQQLTLIKLHITKNKIPTKVVSCPTIRDKGGVALSSRNTKLNKKQINIVKKVYVYLKKNKKYILLNHIKKNELKTLDEIKLLGVRKIDYLKCLNQKTLKIPKTRKENFNIFISYYVDDIRLIDNL